VASGCPKEDKDPVASNLTYLVATHLVSSLPRCPSARRFDAAQPPPSPPARLPTPVCHTPASSSRCWPFLKGGCPRVRLSGFSARPHTKFFRGAHRPGFGLGRTARCGERPGAGERPPQANSAGGQRGPHDGAGCALGVRWGSAVPCG
jgi:hypothetical protein